MSTQKLFDKVQQAEDAFESAQSKLLRATGWAFKCDLPGSLWLWQKTMPDGRIVACAANTAIRIQENIGDAV
jgi:hypothetical protein